MVKIRLRLALPTLSALNSWGWKETTKSVAGSLLGQQKVSSRGDAIGLVPGDRQTASEGKEMKRAKCV